MKGHSPKGVSLEGTICLDQNIPVNQGHKTILVGFPGKNGEGRQKKRSESG